MILPFLMNLLAISSSSLISLRFRAARSRTSSSVSSRHLVRSTVTLLLTSGSFCPTPNLARAVTAAALTMAFSSTTRLYMYRMYLVGDGVLGPSTPIRCRIRTASLVNSQSSMNSQRCANAENISSVQVSINKATHHLLCFQERT